MDLSELEGQWGHVILQLKSHSPSVVIVTLYHSKNPCFCVFGKREISDYFVEISAPGGSSADKMDSDGNRSPLLLRHTQKLGGQRRKRRRTQAKRSEKVQRISQPAEKKTKTEPSNVG